MLFGDQVFSLLWRFVGIHLCQLACSNKKDVIRKLFYGLGILVPDLMLHMLDDLEDFPYRSHQGFHGALFFGDHLFPVPLVYIAGVEIIQLFIPADGVHIGIETFSRLKAVFL